MRSNYVETPHAAPPIHHRTSDRDDASTRCHCHLDLTRPGLQYAAGGTEHPSHETAVWSDMVRPRGASLTVPSEIPTQQLEGRAVFNRRDMSWNCAKRSAPCTQREACMRMIQLHLTVCEGRRENVYLLQEVSCNAVGTL